MIEITAYALTISTSGPIITSPNWLRPFYNSQARPADVSDTCRQRTSKNYFRITLTQVQLNGIMYRENDRQTNRSLLNLDSPKSFPIARIHACPLRLFTSLSHTSHTRLRSLCAHLSTGISLIYGHCTGNLQREVHSRAADSLPGGQRAWNAAAGYSCGCAPRGDVP